MYLFSETTCPFDLKFDMRGRLICVHVGKIVRGTTARQKRVKTLSPARRNLKRHPECIGIRPDPAGSHCIPEIQRLARGGDPLQRTDAQLLELRMKFNYVGRME